MACIWLVVLVLIDIHDTVSLSMKDEWAKSCTPPCTCDMQHFIDLPVTTHWLRQEPALPLVTTQMSNHATYEEIQQDRGELLMMAMCVFQRGTDPKQVLRSLPNNIQVLTILQGRNSGEISLEPDHVQDFQDLMVLDIQGFQQDFNSTSDRVVLRNDALRPLTSLQYLNLQHIKLVGHINVGPSNHIDPIEQPHPRSRNGRKGRKEKDVGKQRMVFLKPTENDIPLVSYQEYKEVIQQAGLTTFAGLTDLLLLRVFACDLQQVHWEMFRGLGKLQHLSLEHNDLLFVPEFAFYGTPHLKSLSLAGNQLLSLQDTSLAGLLELNRLDLSRNNFSHLSELSLPPFPELRTADFRENPVQAVFPSTFEVMNATFVLYLGGDDSPLDLLPNSFLGLSSLKTLNVANVRVPLLEQELLRGMPQLSKLVMTGNIHTIAFDAFLQVSKLEQLILNNCNITAVSMDSFYGLYGLISLDLSSNLMTWLPPGVFDQQFSLKELLLQNNKLTELPSSIFARVPAKMIRLDRNPWHCSCSMKEWQPSAINKVKQLSLSTEGMCQFSYDKGTAACTQAIVVRYVYDKRVAPRCATPSKYNNWNVFHLLRKELHCNKKKQMQDKKAYLKKKFESYERSIQPEHTLSKYQEIERILLGDSSVKLDMNTAHGTQASDSREGLINEQGKKTTTLPQPVTGKHATADTTNLTELIIAQLSPLETENTLNISETVVIVTNKTATTTSRPIEKETEMLSSKKPDLRLEPIPNKKFKQQQAIEKEKETKAALKDKLKLTNYAGSQGEKPDLELKKTLKMNMEKKRTEKLKQMQL